MEQLVGKRDPNSFLVGKRDPNSFNDVSAIHPRCHLFERYFCRQSSWLRAEGYQFGFRSQRRYIRLDESAGHE
jgi:hypothetical protein